ncbi:hypothetical protein [uncultured Thiodictyon sp.]|uniref:hypothetical protein n=1 Tax=uncultured Thiodictyon sp. TaxID=1846217 RepID=UPI0025D68FB5|nr:hypothetical protein [uncultured Thiodictyon sp.]
MPARALQSEPVHILWIKPSHDDDDGYVIQWWRSSLPANSLATVDGIAVDCAQRRVLGPGVQIRVRALDETNRRVGPTRLMRELNEELLADLMGAGLQPLCNDLLDLPDMTGSPTPIPPADQIGLTLGRRARADAGRGGPYQPSFCTTINVQGRKSRHRDGDDGERPVRANWAQGTTTCDAVEATNHVFQDNPSHLDTPESRHPRQPPREPRPPIARLSARPYPVLDRPISYPFILTIQ